MSFEFEDDWLQSNYITVSVDLRILRRLLTTQVMIRLCPRCTMRVGIRQESFPFIGVCLLGFFRRQAVPDTTDGNISQSVLKRRSQTMLTD